jgi:putative NADPH-quinone reductase
LSQTLILVFHPKLSASRANRAMLDAASAINGVTVADMYAQMPDGVIDVDREVARLLAADRVVLQFPVQWYATPALLKTWQDEVLTRMFYVRYATEGKAFEGTPQMVAATAGNVQEAYSPEGINLFPLQELLRPLEATAHRCGLPYASPFLVYRANKLDEAEQAALSRRYCQALQDWISATPARPRGTAGLPALV